MNVRVNLDRSAEPAASSKMAIVDCDIHPLPKSDKDLYPFLEKRWQTHMETYGTAMRMGFQSGGNYPKGQLGAWRTDAWPKGGRPGSDLAFMQQQHLDAHNVALGVLLPLRAGEGLQNLDLSAALCSAMNDWQIEAWTRHDKRLKGSIVVPYDDGPAAAREIERRAGDPNFVQVLLLTRTAEPLGHRRYWPLYEAAERVGLPVAAHAFGFSGAPSTGGGWPSYYIEEMTGHAQSCQSVVTSLVIEGVFERCPNLRFLLVEAGFAWLPPLAWRLDRIWKRLKSERPELKLSPSEYIRRNVWLTTQPMEEPDIREQVLDTIGWIGWDKLMFATDYPHWDFDDPERALPVKITEQQRNMFFRDNAMKFYGLS